MLTKNSDSPIGVWNALVYFILFPNTATRMLRDEPNLFALLKAGQRGMIKSFLEIVTLNIIRTNGQIHL